MHLLTRLIQGMERGGYLRSPYIRDAFLAIDRADFVTPEKRHFAYEDYPLPIGYDQTISTVAFMLEQLQPKPGQKILDIGSGSGWSTALLAYITGETGSVTGLERIPELVTLGQENLAKYMMPWASIMQAGKTVGVPGAQFDRILVNAAAPSFPESLALQLLPNGRMVIPVGDGIDVVTKNAQGHLQRQRFEGFRFVPLYMEETRRV